MRRINFLFIIVLISIIVMFSGCDITPQVELDNFVTDLDLISRFEKIAFNIEFGRWSQIFQEDIEYLIQDLETFEGTHEKSLSVNTKFIKSANAFLDSSRYYFEKNDYQAKLSYTYAKEKYEEALVEYYKFVQ
jgi:hypothetical protein